MPNTPAYIPQTSNQMTGTGFTNLQDYLNANQGNDLNNVLASGINQQIGATNTTLQNAQGDFANQLAGANQAGSAADVANEQNVLGYALNNPNQVTPQDVSQFNKWENQTYNGPTQLSSVSEFPQLTSQLQELQGLGANLNSPSGKSQLLNTFINQPGYTQGQQNFDTMLLGSSPNNNNTLNNLGQQISNVNNNVTGAENQAGAQATNTANQTAQFQGNLLNNLGLSSAGNYTGNIPTGLIEQQNTNLQNQTAADVAAQQAAYAQSQKDLANLNVTGNPYLAQLAGVTTYGVNPLTSDYLTEEATPTASSVASPQQAATLQALSQLAGINNTFVTNPSQVGTYNPTQAVQFATPAYLSQVAAAKANYQKQLNDLQVNSGINNLGAVTGLTTAQAASMTPAQAQAFLQQYSIPFNTGSNADENNVNAGGGTNAFGVLTSGNPLGSSSSNDNVYQVGGNYQGTLPQVIAQNQANLQQFQGMSGNALTGNTTYQADQNQLQQAQNLLNLFQTAYGENQVIKGNQPASLPGASTFSKNV